MNQKLNLKKHEPNNHCITVDINIYRCAFSNELKYQRPSCFAKLKFLCVYNDTVFAVPDDESVPDALLVPAVYVPPE